MDFKNALYLIFIINNVIGGTIPSTGPTPIVLWHGMGDTCCAKGSIGYIKQYFEKNIDGVHINSLMIGDNEEQDFINSYLLDSNKQIEFACDLIKKDDKLKNGFNIIGFSQGGLFARALVQRCQDIKVLNFVSFGGPHEGVYGLPKCSPKEGLCNLVRKWISELGAYNSFVQEHLVQAQYWQSPLEKKEYLENSRFLADINNAKVSKNATYKQNLIQLKNMILIQFKDDTVVVPKDSEWFGFYKDGSTEEVLPMEQRDLYKEDWLGLKVLNEGERLKRLQVPGDHMHINLTWVKENLINKYFSP